MRDIVNEQVDKLAAQFPLWQVWYVPLYVGGYAWCARRHDNHKVVINASSPEHLAEYIALADDENSLS